jgi:hypothetical protein
LPATIFAFLNDRVLLVDHTPSSSSKSVLDPQNTAAAETERNGV